MSDLPPLKLDEGRLLTGIRRGGSTDHGEKAQFEIVFHDNTVEVFRIQYEHLPHFINALRSMAAVVEKHRSGRASSPLDAVVPYRVRKVRVGQSTVGSFAIHFAMEEGIPVQVSMPRNLAESLIADLEGELDRKPPKSDA